MGWLICKYVHGSDITTIVMLFCYLAFINSSCGLWDKEYMMYISYRIKACALQDHYFLMMVAEWSFNFRAIS